MVNETHMSAKLTRGRLVLINFMCQLDGHGMPKYLVKHYSGCFYEDLWNQQTEWSRLPSLVWGHPVSFPFSMKICFSILKGRSTGDEFSFVYSVCLIQFCFSFYLTISLFYLHCGSILAVAFLVESVFLQHFEYVISLPSGWNGFRWYMSHWSI